MTRGLATCTQLAAYHFSIVDEAAKKEPAALRGELFFPQSAIFLSRGSESGTEVAGLAPATGPRTQRRDLFRHQLCERHEIHQNLANGKIGEFAILVKSPVERLNEHLLNLGTGESVGDAGQLAQVKAVRITPQLGDLGLPDGLAFLATNPLFPASGPASSSFNGLYPKSNFLAISSN